MRKVIAGFFISLDGVVEALQDWHFPYFNDEMGEAVADQSSNADTMLFGRKHLRGVRWLLAAAGQRRPVCRRHQQHPEGARHHDAQKRRLGADHDHRPRRRRVGQGTWPIDPARTSRSPAARHLSAPCFASAWSMSFACSSTRSSGHGKRLFETEDQPIPLKLIASKTFQTGVQAMTYAPADQTPA